MREGLEVGVFTYLSLLVELHSQDSDNGVLRLKHGVDHLSRVGILIIWVTLPSQINQLLCRLSPV